MTNTDFFLALPADMLDVFAAGPAKAAQSHAEDRAEDGTPDEGSCSAFVLYFCHGESFALVAGYHDRMPGMVCTFWVLLNGCLIVLFRKHIIWLWPLYQRT